MKKTIISLAVTAGLAASSAAFADATVYGILLAELPFGNATGSLPQCNCLVEGVQGLGPSRVVRRGKDVAA